MSRNIKSALRGLARVAGVFILIAAVGFVGYWALQPTSPSAPSVAALRVEVAPGLQSAVCPAHLILPPADTTNPSFNPAPVPAVGAARILASDGADLQIGEFGPLGAIAQGDPLEIGDQPELLTGLSLDGGKWAMLSPGAQQIQPGLTGLSYSLVTDGDARGLALGQCATPATDIWLLGGSTMVGNSTHLVLQNPATTPAQVEVEVWGANGKVERPGGTVMLNPGTSREIELGGLAPDQRRTVVRVLASGAAITAYLQHTQLEGFTPQGTDWVQATAAPFQSQVITGLHLEESELGSGEGAVLRLLAPSADAEVSLDYFDQSGQQRVPGLSSVSLIGGEVMDLALDGIPAGSWTIVVSATQPITAGVMVPRTGIAGELDASSRRDISWVPGRSAGSQSQMLTLDPEMATQLTVFAATAANNAGGDLTVQVVQRTAAGAVVETTSVSVPSGQTQTATIRPADTTQDTVFELLVPQGAEVYASFEVTQVQPDGELFSVFTPLPTSTDGGQIRIIDPAMN